MSKSILVIDTPEMCHGCDLENEHHCVWHMRYIEDSELETIPDWCPLRDLPEKKEEKQYLNRKDDRGNTETYGKARDMVAVGWNMCIEEILKGDGAE